jgi:tRNA(fMet)-specific endonuclease VapC
VRYLLDANAVIALLTNRPAGVRERFRGTVAAGDSVALPSVVLFELWYGVARSQRRQENAQRLRVFLSSVVESVPFEEDDAAIAGDLRAALEAEGTPIGPYDLLIGAQALRLRARLVTANVSEFGRIKGLDWQDWSSGG